MLVAIEIPPAIMTKDVRVILVVLPWLTIVDLALNAPGRGACARFAVTIELFGGAAVLWGHGEAPSCGAVK
jgi:hypothetical protein